MTPVGPDLVSPRAERDGGPTGMPPGKCEEVIAGREVVLVSDRRGGPMSRRGLRCRHASRIS